MSKLSTKLDELKKNLFVLKHTRKITKDDLRLPEWYEMAEDYKVISATIDKAVLSVKNAIIYQRRLIFCLTRNETRNLVNNDPNWKTKSGLSNENYQAVIKVLIDVGLIKEIKKGSTKSPSVYEVTDLDVLKALNLNIEEQRQEVFKFVEQNQIQDRKPDQSSDQLPDLVDSSKYIVASSKTADVQRIIDSNYEGAVEPVAAASSPIIKVDQGNTSTAQLASKVPLKVSNPAHAELLNKALAVPTARLSPFEQGFLVGKAEALAKFGSFTEKQLKTIEAIANKAQAKALPMLKKHILASLITKEPNAQDIVSKLKEYNLEPAMKSDADLGTALAYRLYHYLGSKHPTVFTEVTQSLGLNVPAITPELIKKLRERFNREYFSSSRQAERSYSYHD